MTKQDLSEMKSKGKINKNYQIGKEMNLPLFADNIILYMENFNKSTKKLWVYTGIFPSSVYPEVLETATPRYNGHIGAQIFVSNTILQ